MVRAVLVAEVLKVIVMIMIVNSILPGMGFRPRADPVPLIAQNYPPNSHRQIGALTLPVYHVRLASVRTPQQLKLNVFNKE